MTELLRKVRRIPLLTSTTAFEQAVLSARKENEQSSTAHLLNERLVYSLLAYRSRKSLGASLREIARETGLHPRTVKAAVENLCDLTHEHDGLWYANQPPDGWFRTIPTEKPKHWAENYAYTWLLLPHKGATFSTMGRTADSP